MRILPYLLVLAMAAPIFFWIAIDMLVIKGQTTAFVGADMIVMVSLGACTLLAFILLATWIDKAIQKMG